jgi:predicted RNase H-like HicB family nuclease
MSMMEESLTNLREALGLYLEDDALSNERE